MMREENVKTPLTKQLEIADARLLLQPNERNAPERCVSLRPLKAVGSKLFLS